MSELEEMVVNDMREWITVKVLNGEDMFEHLDTLMRTEGQSASSAKLKEFAENYWSNHMGL